jgi:CRP-like cAMP-binding protein
MEVVDSAEVIEQLGLPYFQELATFGALSNEIIIDLLTSGTIRRFSKGEYLARFDVTATDFQVLLQGKMAFYKHCEGYDILTRHFNEGDQMGFDLMLGLIPHNGTDVAIEDCLLLDISSAQFYNLHVDYPIDFGLLMINLARELSREIALLENVIEESPLWQLEK